MTPGRPTLSPELRAGGPQLRSHQPPSGDCSSTGLTGTITRIGKSCRKMRVLCDDCRTRLVPAANREQLRSSRYYWRRPRPARRHPAPGGRVQFANRPCRQTAFQIATVAMSAPPFLRREHPGRAPWSPAMGDHLDVGQPSAGRVQAAKLQSSLPPSVHAAPNPTTIRAAPGPQCRGDELAGRPVGAASAVSARAAKATPDHKPAHPNTRLPSPDRTPTCRVHATVFSGLQTRSRRVSPSRPPSTPTNL